MSTPTQPKIRITRRKLAKLALTSAVVAPAARIVSLKIKDNPLPEIAQPALIIEGGWILDVRDSGNTEVAG